MEQQHVEEMESAMGSAREATRAPKGQGKRSVAVRGSKTGAFFPHHFVKRGENPYHQMKWERRTSTITGAAGETVFEMRDIEVPASWSQLATDICMSKYLRKAGVPQTGHETSVRQVVYRVAHTIRKAGENLGGYFHSSEEAQSFENELSHILLQQKGAFNSPVWFNCGLFQEYGIEGTSGNFFWNPVHDRIELTKTAYENPQCSACFIQSVEDDLMAIFELAKSEARIFKYGSGTGTNFSKVRGKQERLSGGGQSSGLMSFLEVLDRGAGATKSGGTTRRAAKMVCLDMDHPEIESFINWKVREEKKVKLMVESGYSSDMNGEAYRTVGGQNSNNSVRIPDEFMESVLEDKDWTTKARTSGEVMDTYRATDLWDQIAFAAWACADPGLQFDSTIQKWHTCATTGRINASNPCSEYMFLDDSACNLASLNLLKFLREDGSFDVESFRHASRILLTAQDILVDFSSYPTERIAQNSHEFRPLGLGYANLGTLLMIKGVPYDSHEARVWAAAITAIMHGEAYRTSAEIAAVKGPFVRFEENRESMSRVLGQHFQKANEIDMSCLPEYMATSVKSVWNEVLELSEEYGVRNAQVSVLAPTGTIGLLMDCDTTGIEPDFALVKYKKLAGGGYFKIVNQSVPKALRALGYGDEQVGRIIEFAIGTSRLDGTPHINRQTLAGKGFCDEDFSKIEKALPSAFDLNSAIAPWVIGKEGMARLRLDESELDGRSVLEALGFNKKQIKEASQVICGRMTLEGAPELKLEHMKVFDCANKCGPDGVRFIAPEAHIKMMAAVQPFISGAISKTVNLPQESTVSDIKSLYEMSWRLGLKAVAVYRDGCKLSQPLSTQTKKKSERAEKPVGEGEEAAVYTRKDLEEAIAQALQYAPARRRKMPQKRTGMTVEGRVGGHQIYLRTGEYDDGRLGEIFIDMHKEGATLRSLLNCFAISVSMGLQYGVPLEDYVEKFTFTRFEPQGMVDHPNIKQATSILDYVFRLLGMEYLGKTEFIHVKPNTEALAMNRRNGQMTVIESKANVDREQLALPLEMAVVPKKPEASTAHGGSGGVGIGALDSQLSTLMGDAPFCNECGHTTVRNGSCYRCLNCGNSMGCS